MIAALLALGALASSTAWAGVEYVTRIGNCTNKVDTIGDGKDLFIIAGQDVRFEVFGNSIDLASSLRVGVDSGAGTVTARILKKRSGFDNNGRGCGFIGSAEVEVDSPIASTSDIQRSLFFRMPAGDESRLQMKIVALPSFTMTWEPSSAPCLVGTGSLQILNQSKLLRLQLPPGHRQDQSNCTASFNVKATMSSIGELDIQPERGRFGTQGMPGFLTVAGSTASFTAAQATFNLAINTAGIRALTANNTSTITFSSPKPNRTSTLNLEVRVDLGPGFSAVAVCTPGQLNVGDLTDCTLRLAAPAPPGQRITWRMTTATCFAKDLRTGAPYDPAATFQVFEFPTGQGQAIIRVRSAPGANCADKDGVTHRFEAWIGDFRTDPQVTAPSFGPRFTQTTIRVVSTP